MQDITPQGKYYDMLIMLLEKAEVVFTSAFLVVPFYLGSLVVLIYDIANADRLHLAALLLLPTGIIIITLVEYLVHRFLFHHKQPNFLLSKIHARHHQHPLESRFGTIPLPASVLLICLIAAPFYFLFDRTSFTMLVIGLILGYMFHEYTHFANHKQPPRTAFGKFQKRYHDHHHYKSQQCNFGFMVPFWDMIFKTYKK